jgi:hypothetical protein
VKEQQIPPIEDEECDEAEWLRAAAQSPAFDSLAEPEEDVYTIEDGKPFKDQMPSRLASIEGGHLPNI